MKSKHIFAVLFSLLAAGVFAQGPGGQQRMSPEEREAAMRAEMERTILALELSEEQATQFREINERYGAKGKELRDQIRSGEIPREESRDYFMDLMLERDDEIRDILEKPQWKAYKKMQRERQEEMMKRRGGPGGGGPGGPPRGGGF